MSDQVKPCERCQGTGFYDTAGRVCFACKGDGTEPRYPDEAKPAVRQVGHVAVILYVDPTGYHQAVVAETGWASMHGCTHMRCYGKGHGPDRLAALTSLAAEMNRRFMTGLLRVVNTEKVGRVLRPAHEDHAS